VTLKKNLGKRKQTKAHTRKPKKSKLKARKPNKAKALNQSVPLEEALPIASTTMEVAPEPTVDDVLHQWLSESIPGQPIPNVDQLQVAWKDFGPGGAFTVQVQQNLANLLNNAFALDPQLVPANLPATLTVGQLKQNLNRSA
jgi:hypothetical protein